jgi:uncharacterized protein YerC
MSSTPLLPGGIGFYKAGFTHSAHHITGLSLHGKELDTLPDSIQVLTRLERLYACNNQLTTLPSTIGALTNHLFLRIKFALVQNGHAASSTPRLTGASTPPQREAHSRVIFSYHGVCLILNS